MICGILFFYVYGVISAQAIGVKQLFLIQLITNIIVIGGIGTQGTMTTSSQYVIVVFSFNYNEVTNLKHSHPLISLLLFSPKRSKKKEEKVKEE